MRQMWKQTLSATLVSLVILTGGLSGCSSTNSTDKAVEELPMMTAEEERAALRKADPAGKYGHALVAESATSISEINQNAEKYLEKTVRIEGVVDEVCPMRGCWIVIADDAGEKMRVKVTDGRIVFPLSAQGEKAIAEGKLMKIEYNAEEAMAYRAHLAEEKGLPFNPETAEQGPMVVWQLDGKGAVIGE